jgi:hypothetical protein
MVCKLGFLLFGEWSVPLNKVLSDKIADAFPWAIVWCVVFELLGMKIGLEARPVETKKKLTKKSQKLAFIYLAYMCQFERSLAMDFNKTWHNWRLGLQPTLSSMESFMLVDKRI